MADADEKARAEKLAAAKKRVAQLQKKKAKKGKKDGGETSKQGAAVAAQPDSSQKQEDIESSEEKKTQQEDEPVEPEESAKDEALEEIESEELNKLENITNNNEGSPPGRSHDRQTSVSLQSQMRSSSFRQTSGLSPSTSQSKPSGVKSPPLAPLSPDGSTAPEVFRKQSLKLEELDKDNKRLEKELETANSKFKRSEEQLEDLRETNSETVELKERLAKAEKQTEEMEKLRTEITALQRQNSHLHTRTHRPSNSAAVSGSSDSPPSELLSQLDSKSATVEAMELEISNLRAQLNSQSTHSSAHQEQITALEEKLSRSETSLDKTQRELTDTKQALTRASEKAVKEGVDKTSTETLIKNLERQAQEVQHAKEEADKKVDLLEKKLQALGNLHKESESRNQTRLRERDKFEKDVAILRRKLVTIENENSRLREERERAKKRDAVGVENEEGLDELEDEERARLERRVRELEGENFDLRRGIWKEKKRELTGDQGDDVTGSDRPISSSGFDSAGAGGSFDDVDLIGGGSGGYEHSRRRSMSRRPQQHSSFATVLSSGIAAFTGAGGSSPHENMSSAGTGPSHMDGEDDLLDDDAAFDADAFALAQAEDEARKRVEWAREVKSKLKDWKGWRLDLVECRYGAQGAGVDLGEIFEA